MATLITDPNAPPDPGAVRPIPDGQYPGGPPTISDTRFNPTTPGAPPSPEFPTGVPPEEAQQPPSQPEQPPVEPPPEQPPVEPPVEPEKHSKHDEPKKKK